MYYYLIENAEEPHILFYCPALHKWLEDVWYGVPAAARAVGRRTTKFGIPVIKFDPRVARAWAEKHKGER